MSDLEASRVEDAIRNRFSQGYYGDYFWETFAYGNTGDTEGSVWIDGTEYDVVNEASKTGSEGDWQTEIYVVVKVGEQYFRKSGHYASHDGTYWDGRFEEVKPQEKPVTVWDRV